MKITELTRCSERDSNGNLRVDFAESIATAYPEIEIKGYAPNWRGHSGNLDLRGKTLWIPDGQYRSGKHFHTASSWIIAVESSRHKHNLKGCPLYLLRGHAYNGDFRSVKSTYWILGKNEDDSFFLHKIRPSVGETGDFDQVRNWMWQIKGQETLAARQGDLGFIRKKRAFGRLDPTAQTVQIGNHKIYGDAIHRTAHRIYVVNPRAEHGEHYAVHQQGIFELRLARQWELGAGD